MSPKKGIDDTLSSLIECLDRIGRIYDSIEQLKNNYSDEIYLNELVYSLHKELYDGHLFCVMGCAYAEYPRYNDSYYENKKAQAIDAIRCLVPEMIRRLSLMLYDFHLKLNQAINKEENYRIQLQF